jgi:hypothetical protein
MCHPDCNRDDIYITTDRNRGHVNNIYNLSARFTVGFPDIPEYGIAIELNAFPAQDIDFIFMIQLVKPVMLPFSDSYIITGSSSIGIHTFAFHVRLDITIILVLYPDIETLAVPDKLLYILD